jgi:predicted HD phosphohydrolase
MEHPSRRDLLKTAVLTLGATTAGFGMGVIASASSEPEPPSIGGSTTTSGLPPLREEGREEFLLEARDIYDRHWAQTAETVAALRKKHDRPLVGRVRMWDVLQQLGQCVDRADGTLYCASQLVHVEQMLAAMQDEGVDDADLIVAALTHDLGKILILHGEEPENVFCANRPIGDYQEGVGLDNVVFQWNHDEFAYSRLVDHVPDHVAWLIRYHSIDFRRTRPFMDSRDIDYFERYLISFRHWDQDFKSAFSMPPQGTLSRHRDLIEQRFPKPIVV